jgi:glycosyltransferase involved in cell wall biosynthesis
MAELIDEGKTGLLTAPYDVVALAEALDSVLSNFDLAQRMGLAAQAQRGRFSIDRFVPDVEAVYQRVSH